MIETSAHMLLLLQQAKIKNEHPEDNSFLPLSLSMACLLRQLPAGLAPPAGGLSFHQLDRLPQAVLERKLAAMILDDPLRVFTFVCSIVRYVKTTRALLTVCHDHMTSKKTTVEATQGVVQAVVDALPLLIPTPEDDVEKKNEEQEQIEEPTSNTETVLKTPNMQPHESISEKPPSVVATDPAGIMRRAVGRDVGDGSAVLEIMKKYPTDERIQSHGVRALKGVMRNEGTSAEPGQGSVISHKQKQGAAAVAISTLEVAKDDVDNAEIFHQNQQSDASSQAIVLMVIDKMKQFPGSIALQRDGLICLAEYANQADGHVAVITSGGGVISIVDAMVLLPDDVPANMAGLSILAHPKIADESIVRVNPESRRLVLSSMERFPLNEQIQGLGCLALANLSLRQDASMVEIVSKGGLEIVIESMKRFSTTSLVQAAGCWLIAIISGKNEEMKAACLEAGALPASEKARLRFPDDPKVQQHAVQAIQTMLPGELNDQQEAVPLPSCQLQ